MFGTESESPIPLRYYAGALINSAVSLHPDSLPTATQEDWIGRLLWGKQANGHNYFSCTDILACMMKDTLKSTDSMIMLYPSFW